MYSDGEDSRWLCMNFGFVGSFYEFHDAGMCPECDEVDDVCEVDDDNYPGPL